MLAGELPRSSRFFEYFNKGPDFSHSDYMLSLIEFWTHLNIWSKSKDAKNMKNKPEFNIPSYLTITEEQELFDELALMSEEDIYAYIYKGREDNIRRKD